MANIMAWLLCEGRPRDDEPGDTAISAGQIVMSATRIERGHPVQVPKTELQRTVGSLPGNSHRA